jgi:hypothetical protein
LQARTCSGLVRRTPEFPTKPTAEPLPMPPGRAIDQSPADVMQTAHADGGLKASRHRSRPGPHPVAAPLRLDSVRMGYTLIVHARAVLFVPARQCQITESLRRRRESASCDETPMHGITACTRAWQHASPNKYDGDRLGVQGASGTNRGFCTWSDRTDAVRVYSRLFLAGSMKWIKLSRAHRK